MQQGEDYFTVVFGQKRIIVNKRITEVSQYLHNLLSMGLDEEEIQIDPDIVSLQTFNQFTNYCQINDYKQPDIAKKIRTHNLSEVMDEQNYNFIKEYRIDEDQIYKLLNAANFFVCRGLLKLIAAVFACKIYFQDTKSAFEGKKKEMGIEKEISFEDQEFYKSNYYFEDNK